jgi:UDP-glucose 4-epimerase
MKILVTGGTGYIGSHTVVELQDKGFEVIIADNLSNSHIDVLDHIETITGIRPGFEKVDLAEFQPTQKFFLDHPGIGAIIHFAAYKAVGESVEFPLMYYRNNLISLMNVLECMKNSGIGKIVFSSSCTVYGQPDELPVKETSPVKTAMSPYGNTKQISEEIIQDFSKVSDIRAILLRYFNPIGAHSSAMIGELPLGIPNNLVPYLTQTAIGKRDFLRVWGNDYDTPDGTPIRDYIHVVDIARAHVIAVERMLQEGYDKKIEVFNLGTGRGYSVMEVIKSFEKVSGMKLKYKILSRRTGDIIKVWADTDYANRELGWKAELDLNDMMRSAWNWEKALANQNKNNYSKR